MHRERTTRADAADRFAREGAFGPTGEVSNRRIARPQASRDLYKTMLVPMQKKIKTISGDLSHKICYFKPAIDSET